MDKLDIVKICKVDNCDKPRDNSTKNTKLCKIHRYNWSYYKSHEKPIKILPDGIIHICRKHGELTQDQTQQNRTSPNGRRYFRCRLCRNESSQNQLRAKYIITPKKHEKIKVPSFVTQENKSHAYTVLHRFKLTADKYYAMLESQGHVCAICKNPETQIKRKSNKVKMLSVDHCHKTGKVRGLLCFSCNIGLGAFKDSIDTMNDAIAYLSSHEDFGACESNLEPGQS